MNYKRIQEAATESRMASAETITTFGLQTSIDDAVALTGAELTYDEVAESAFAKGAEWLMMQPLSDRLTDDEIKRIKAIYTRKTYGIEDLNKKVTEECLLEALFGLDFLNEKGE